MLSEHVRTDGGVAAHDRPLFFGQWTCLAWGLTPILCGITMLRSGKFKTWMGVLPIASGLSGLTVGVIHDLSDFSLGLLPPFYAAVAGFNLWLIVMGVQLWRRGASLAAPK